jgi:uracil-DNA glycosylase family 4
MSEHEQLMELVADLRALVESARADGYRWDAPALEVDAALRDAPAVSERDAEEAEARVIETLEDVRAALGDCRRCGLCEGRTRIVFGAGRSDADLMIIGEAPGFNEDQTGEPFVGAAGEMLDKMLLHVLGLRRDQVYITNVVKCRPPDNRNPHPTEVLACQPFLMRQIATVKPRIILILGSVAYRNLFQTTEGILRARGRWLDFEGVPVMPTLHPAYLLRTPEHKRLVFEDLKELKVRLEALLSSG